MSRRAAPRGCVVVLLVLATAALRIASPGPLAFFAPRAPSTGSAISLQAEGEEASGPNLQEDDDQREELAQKVYQMQRTSFEAANAWDGFVARRFSGALRSSIDPRKNSAKCLQDFLDSYEQGVRLRATWQLLDDLARVVPQLDVAWKKRVLSEESDTPSRLTRNSRVATAFLEKLAEATLDAEDHVTSKGHKSLVTRALCFEPSFKEYVKDLGLVQTNPRHYPASFLKAFLEKQPQWTPEHEAALERVRELVSTKQEEWKRFAAGRTDMRGRKAFDPIFHTQSSLEAFILAMESA